MARSRNDILWRFLADTKSLERGNREAQSGFKATNRVAGASQAIFSGITKAVGALGLALGGREILQWTGDALQMGIAADEVDSKFQAVFGSAKTFNDELDALGDMAGVTTTDMRDLAATFGNLAMSSGLSKEATKELTTSVATLALDMASFNDDDPAEVFRTLNTATLTAERDGLKKYGISVSENEVKTRAMAIAVADGRDEITKADKALASYELISKAAGKANGDLERTQDSLANQQRQLTASVEEMKEAFGRELAGALADATEEVKASEVELAGLGTTAGKLVTRYLKPMIESIDDVAVATDESAEATDRWSGALETANGVVSFFSPALRILNEMIDAGGHATNQARDEMDEYKKGIEATTQAIADSKPVSEAYIGFMKQIRDSQADVAVAAEDTATKLDELKEAYERLLVDQAKDPHGIWDTSTWMKLWGNIDTASTKAATFADIMDAWGISDPVAVGQRVNDFVDLNGQTGG